jgi:glutathione S-transferase
LAADHPTIADIACYPYVVLAPDGDVELGEFPSVQKWLKRFEDLPGYISIKN